MRRHCAAALLAAVGLSLASAAARAQTPALAPEYYPNVVVERGVELPMRDGVVLRATMLRPDAPGTFPTLVYRTPYGQERLAEEPDFPVKAARRGYVVLLVDVRGRYTSDGEFEAYRQEKADGYDTIEWAGQCEFCNGRVGSWGGSYPGFVQWLALSQAPPHYTTAVPTMTPTSSHHFFYMGGGFNLTWFDWFIPLIVPDLRRRAGDESGPWDGDAAYAQWTPERRRWYLQRPLVSPPLLRRWAPYYYDWLTHPDDTDWWRFADVESDFGKITAPVMLVTGWYDNNYGPVGATRGFAGMRSGAGSAAARERTKLLIGPWTHTDITVLKTRFGAIDFGPNAGLDFHGVLLRWFDARLKNLDNGFDAEPPVQIFVMGANRWRSEHEWPLSRARSTPLFLASTGVAGTVGGELTSVQRLDDAERDEYTYDPADPLWDEQFEYSGALAQGDFEARDDVLVYTTPPLTRDIEVTGEIEVELWVSTDVPDTDLAVRVSDVHPDGTSYAVNGPESGFLRLRYREGNDRQVLIDPGQVVRVRIGQMLTSNLFRRGHRIRLQVTSSRAPHFDPNPNTGREIATETELRPARIIVWHDAERPSRVLLPVVEGS